MVSWDVVTTAKFSNMVLIDNIRGACLLNGGNGEEGRTVEVENLHIWGETDGEDDMC